MLARLVLGLGLSVRFWLFCLWDLGYPLCAKIDWSTEKAITTFPVPQCLFYRCWISVSCMCVKPSALGLCYGIGVYPGSVDTYLHFPVSLWWQHCCHCPEHVRSVHLLTSEPYYTAAQSTVTVAEVRCLLLGRTNKLPTTHWEAVQSHQQ